MPKYPKSSQNSGFEGGVDLYADVGKQGQIRGLEVIHSLSPELDASALQAVRQWRYTPFVCKGVTLGWTGSIYVNFSLW